MCPVQLPQLGGVQRIGNKYDFPTYGAGVALRPDTGVLGDDVRFVEKVIAGQEHNAFCEPRRLHKGLEAYAAVRSLRRYRCSTAARYYLVPEKVVLIKKFYRFVVLDLVPCRKVVSERSHSRYLRYFAACVGLRKLKEEWRS
jgi:hypothetical protein